MEEVLLSILRGDEPEAAVVDHLLDGSVRHSETSHPSLEFLALDRTRLKRRTGTAANRRPTFRANKATLANLVARANPSGEPGGEPRNGSLNRAMTALLACLSPYSEETVRAMLKGRRDVDIVFVPEPPAQQAVLDATHAAHLVIADKRHLHRIDRRVLENMRNCLLIQQAAVGFDSIDHRAAAEYNIPVANAAGYNREAVADWTILAILSLLRHGSWGDRQMHAGWWGRTEMMGRQLGSTTVGIVGLGNVGGTVALRLTGFGVWGGYTDPVP